MKRALVVEDESVVREALRMMLDTVGIAIIVEATNVEQGMAAYKGYAPFDLFLIDLILPGAHGTCLVDKISMEERSKILVMSGYVDDNVYWMCSHLGLKKRQILPKPIDFDCLKTKMREIEAGGVK